MKYSRIAGTGSFLPERVVTNVELEKTIDTTDAWIRERTGIERRQQHERQINRQCINRFKVYRPGELDEQRPHP